MFLFQKEDNDIDRNEMKLRFVNHLFDAQSFFGISENNHQKYLHVYIYINDKTIYTILVAYPDEHIFINIKLSIFRGYYNITITISNL